jgi:plasmid stability protein
MPAITVKNIPDDLYQKLKQTAEINHRSINSELIHCLECVLRPVRMTADQRLEVAARIRSQTAAITATEDSLNRRKNQGRP